MRILETSEDGFKYLEGGGLEYLVKVDSNTWRLVKADTNTWRLVKVDSNT
jgi:hypothetical protein